MPQKSARFLIAALSVNALACTVGDRDLALPNPHVGHRGHDEGYVAVFSGEMPPAIDQVARHAWVIVHVPGDADLVRCEWTGHGRCEHTSDAFSYFGHGNVAMHGFGIARFVLLLVGRDDVVDDSGR
jgi:hypothetical protein